jgi:hypothetical protein
MSRRQGSTWSRPSSAVIGNLLTGVRRVWVRAHLLYFPARAGFTDLCEMRSRIGPVPGREPDACRVRRKRLSRFPQFGWHEAALVDNAKQVLPVKTQTSINQPVWPEGMAKACLPEGFRFHHLWGSGWSGSRCTERRRSSSCPCPSLPFWLAAS